MNIRHAFFRIGQGHKSRQLALLVPAAILIYLLAAATMNGAAADSPPEPKATDGATKGLMHAFVLEFAKMNPYLTGDKAFNSAEGKATIGKSLKVLANKVKDPPPALEKSPGFRITFGLLADHLRKTEEAWRAGETDNVRMRVNGVGNLCAACHMQAPKISNFSAFEFVTERSKAANFHNAEFLFVIRRYDDALALYDQLVRGYPKSGITSDQLTEAYRRKLAIFARVYRDPVKAGANLAEDLKNSNLPADIRKNIEGWSAALTAWKSEKTDPAKLTTPQLLDYAAKNLPADLVRKIAPDNPQLLNLLRISGLLYERLYREPPAPNKDTQGLLYFMAKCERSLAPLYWYSVNEIYLKECVVQYPKQAYSKKCFDAYQEGMQERYFGRPLPESVQTSIEAMKQFL
jgi:cytochrome c556